MFGKKNTKLKILKDMIGSRAGYSETVHILELDKKEKDIFLQAHLAVNKKKPNLEIIDEAYEILLDKDKNSDKSKKNSEDNDKILNFVKETIGESSKFMEHINKYNFSQNEKAILSGVFSDLKKEQYDIDKIHSAYAIIKKYKNKSKNQESLLFCSNCGASLNKNIKFCSECGTAILVKNQKNNLTPRQPPSHTVKKSFLVAEPIY